MNYNGVGSVVRHTLNRRNPTAFLAVLVSRRRAVKAQARVEQFASKRCRSIRAWRRSGAASVDWAWSTPALTGARGDSHRHPCASLDVADRLADRSQVVRKHVLRNLQRGSSSESVSRAPASLSSSLGTARASSGCSGTTSRFCRRRRSRPWILNWEIVCEVERRLRRPATAANRTGERVVPPPTGREAQVAACLEVPPSDARNGVLGPLRASSYARDHVPSMLARRCRRRSRPRRRRSRAALRLDARRSAWIGGLCALVVASPRATSQRRSATCFLRPRMTRAPRRGSVNVNDAVELVRSPGVQ